MQAAFAVLRHACQPQLHCGVGFAWTVQQRVAMQPVCLRSCSSMHLNEDPWGCR